MNNKNQDSSWISFSDIMTGLMVIFMFIAIAYLNEVQQQQNQRDELFKEFKLVRENIYNDLDSVFKDDFELWEAKLNDDLTISFENPQVLFSENSYKLTSTFKKILNEFFPKYFNVLLQDKYIDKISEIRIEGHTDPNTPPRGDYRNSYLDNLALSQKRSEKVMAHYIKSNFYKDLPTNNRNWLLFHFTSNGLSYSKRLDKNGRYTFETQESCDNNQSRRVEFRIVTSSEQLVEQVLKELSEK